MIMTKTEFNEMMEASMYSNLSEVVEITSCAGDNAAEVVGFDNRTDAAGEFTMAFAKACIDTIEGMLCYNEFGTPAAKSFFKQFEITAK